MADHVLDIARNTVIFLRMTAIQPRRITEELTASDDVELKTQLRHLASQCEAEAQDLAERFGLGDLLRSS